MVFLGIRMRVKDLIFFLLIKSIELVMIVFFDCWVFIGILLLLGGFLFLICCFIWLFDVGFINYFLLMREFILSLENLDDCFKVMGRGNGRNGMWI